MTRGVKVSVALGYREYEVGNRYALGLFYAVLFNSDAAQSCLEMVISSQSPMDALGRRNCWVQQAEFVLLQDNPHMALNIIEQLIKTAPGMSPEHVITSLWWLNGKALATIGDAVGAQSHFQAAIMNARATGVRFLLWCIHASLGHLYRNMGQQDASEVKSLEASKLIDELAVTIPHEMLKERFRHGTFNDLTLEASQ